MGHAVDEWNERRQSAKKIRQMNLKELIQTNKALSSQEDIIEAYQKKHSVRLEQSTVSKDLKELHIIKRGNRYILGPETEQEEHRDWLWTRKEEDCLIFHEAVQTLVLHTAEGKAQETAFHLKKAYETVVLATIAQLDRVIVFVNKEASEYDSFYELVSTF